MSSSFIPPGLDRLWSAWNIRGFMFLSLSMQLLLASAAPFRKRTSNPLAAFLVWSAYFLADWAAIFAFGLITNSGCQSSSGQPEVGPNVLALWAAFLMMHLGGPDTITAFSLEDNALWLRHLVGLVAQIFAFFFIFAKALPDKNSLLVPTILIFVAGVIKYGERTRALYLASLERMKKSVENSPETSLSDLDPGEDESSKSAFQLLSMLKGWIVDVMPSNLVWKDSREFFRNQDAKVAYVTLTKEMSFLYNILYTKTLAVTSWWGVLIRSVAYNNLLIALILFCLSKKQELHEVDVNITYLLFAGALALDMASGIMLVVSQRETNDESLGGCLIILQGFAPLVGIMVYGFLQGCCFDAMANRSWSENMGSFDFLNYHFKQCNHLVQGHACRAAFGLIAEKIGITEGVAEIIYVSKITFKIELWELVFDDLRQKALLASDVAKAREIFEARGNLTLSERNCDDLMHFIKDFEYGSTLLMWHVATHICIHLEGEENDDTDKWISETISNYMLYLLVKQPKMMSPVVGLSRVRYYDTSAEVKRFGRRFDARSREEFCKKILEENDSGVEPPKQEPMGSGKAVLIDSCDLAKLLLKKDLKWKIISGVWMELLSYAACHCKVDSHVRILCEGGEFISLVWLLMAHLGIGGLHLPIE